MYKIIIEKNVLKFFEKHKGEKIILIFNEKIKVLSQNPYNNNLDISALTGEQDIYRLRIGKYRFLYKINEEIITIKFFIADSRGGVYK